LDHGPKFLACLRKAVAVTALAVQRLSADHSRSFEVPQSAREQRSRDERDSAMNLVEVLGPGEQLAKDDRSPSLGEDLAGHRNGAKLAKAGLHGLEASLPGTAAQVHFLN
jgi:hypothetical protein